MAVAPAPSSCCGADSGPDPATSWSRDIGPAHPTYPEIRTVHSFQREFIELTLARDVLRFGEFTLKSGRTSPYFFNMGRIDSGAALSRLGSAYAAAALRSEVRFDMLFGPAYKGIALAAATAIALANDHGRDLPWAYNRKEAKDHGEGGVLVGAPLQGRVLIVDDVMTAGTAVRESLQLIRAQGAEPAGVLIALDRQERGKGDLSAAQEVSAEYGIPVIAIASLADVLTYAGERPELAAEHGRLQAYREQYGVSA
jgi:orotate phosphoribosyltransferase